MRGLPGTHVVNGLPEGWESRPLGNLVEAKYGKGLRKDRRADGGIAVYGSNGQVGRHSSALSRGTTLVIGRKGTAGAVHFSPGPCWPIDTTYFIDEFPGDLDPRYLYRFLSSQNLAQLDRSTAIPGLNRDDLYAVRVRLPPLPEQRRIVEKMERLLEQSRTAREALDPIPSLLKRFRQSVLAKAFRGELTERDPGDEPASVLLERIREERRRKWEENLRAKGKDPRRAKYVEPEPPATSGLPELPEAWVWTALGDVIELLQYGSSVKAEGQEGSGVPIIRMGNIQDGGINLMSLKYVHESSEDIPRYLLQEDDILINRTNSPELVGKAARWNIDGDYIFASYLIRLRADTRIIAPSCLIHVINSETSRGHIARVRHQVAGQSNINSHDIRAIPVPLAPLHEQRQIVAKVEALFAQADAIEQAAAKARRRAEQVDQAVLARAFRGEL